MYNLEEIAEEIKLELHDKHMMYIDGEDDVTHRWCKQIIWRVLKKHLHQEIEDLNHYQNNTIVAYDRSQLDDALGKKATDADWAVCQDAIHNNDYAWSAMSDACANAEEEVSNA